jgi:ribosomal protein S18 acetylase RimI-like enzyme
MSQQIAIRKARSQDMVQCAAIFNEWVDETEWMPRLHSHDDVVRFYKDEVYPQRRTLVAGTAAMVTGYATLSEDGYVSALYVRPKYRRLGIGSLLMRNAKEELGEVVKVYSFQANTAALNFYDNHGFKEINRTDGDNEEKLADVLLEWQAGDDE